jgi:predicted LPLAT superfamily acyltransferase
MTIEKKSTDSETSKPHWSSIREAGTLFGLKFLGFVYKVFGRWPVTICLIPTVAYFVLFRGATRRSSQEYLQNHYQQFPEQWAKPPGLGSTYKHLFLFAETVVDKLLSWVMEIDADNFVIEHPERIEALMADDRGQ